MIYSRNTRKTAGAALATLTVLVLSLAMLVGCGGGPSVEGEWVTEDGEILIFGDEGALLAIGEEATYELDGSEMTITDSTGTTRTFTVEQEEDSLKLLEGEHPWLELERKVVWSEDELVAGWAQDPESFSGKQYVFQNDGTFLFSDNWGSDAGTWEYTEDGKLALTEDGRDEAFTFDPVRVGDQLYLVDEDYYPGNPFERVEL